MIHLFLSPTEQFIVYLLRAGARQNWIPDPTESTVQQEREMRKSQSSVMSVVKKHKVLWKGLMFSFQFRLLCRNDVQAGIYLKEIDKQGKGIPG